MKVCAERHVSLKALEDNLRSEESSFSLHTAYVSNVSAVPFPTRRVESEPFRL